MVSSSTPTIGAVVTLTATWPIPAAGSSASGTASASAAAWLSEGRSTSTAALASTMARTSLASTHQWRASPQRVPQPEQDAGQKGRQGQRHQHRRHEQVHGQVGGADQVRVAADQAGDAQGEQDRVGAQGADRDHDVGGQQQVAPAPG